MYKLNQICTAGELQRGNVSDGSDDNKEPGVGREEDLHLSNLERIQENIWKSFVIIQMRMIYEEQLVVKIYTGIKNKTVKILVEWNVK